MKIKKKNNRKFIIAAVFIFCITIVLYLIIAKLSADRTEYGIENDIVDMVAPSLLSVSDISKDAKNGEYVVDGKIQYNRLFGKNLVIGDSISEGLKVYGFLDDNQVVCEIGGSVMKGEEAIAEASKLKATNVFFSYGTNDMGMYSGDADAFVEDYSTIIFEFMSICPDADIYVNSIAKPSEEKIASGGNFHKWKEFNKKIKNMCDEFGFCYIDNVYILEENPNLYAGDGIHVLPEYYPIWITNMIKKISSC
ncbi:MAG: hypothetical protein DBY08_01970 [Clostridiales bacterium]|nr:MAG: hypothetical protein DBY08_01970 [Clostridiales bacterium]